MEVQGCGDCGKAVSTTDIEEGGAGDVGGIFFCADCYAKLSASEAQGSSGDGSLELLTPSTPRQPAPQKRPSGRSSRRAKSASRAVRRVSGPQKAVRPPSSARRKAAGSSSQRAAKVSPSGRARAVQNSSSSRVRRVQAASPTSSGRLQSQSGRYVTESGRYEGASGRYAAPRKSNTALVMVLILVIIGLLGGVIAVLLLREPPAQGDGQVSQNNGGTDANAGGTDANAGGTDANAGGTDANAGGTDANAGGTDGDNPPDPAKTAEARTAIQNAIDNREFEKAWQLATEAKKAFPDDPDIAAALDGALTKLRSHCQTSLDRADELKGEDRAQDAHEILTALTEMDFDEFHQQAQSRLDKLQEEEAAAAATDENEEAAKKEFLNASIYFNDFQDKKENGDKALAGFNLLLTKYKNTTFAQKKKEFIEMAIHILQGGELPAPDFR